MTIYIRHELMAEIRKEVTARWEAGLEDEVTEYLVALSEDTQPDFDADNDCTYTIRRLPCQR